MKFTPKDPGRGEKEDIPPLPPDRPITLADWQALINTLSVELGSMRTKIEKLERAVRGLSSKPPKKGY